ncbi:MAG: sigma-70 family RNA polymerase sigma factor [Clostridium sp.]|nr:sigma-70 family RNA polymerase sigma factor [Clostridium sp.]
MMGDDREAFDQLMEFYYPRILRMAYLISGSYADSQDIVQETFVICWINRKKIKEPEHFSKWLYKTLTREAWRFCRKSRREQPVEEVFGDREPQRASALEEVLARSRDEALHRAIEALPVKQRTAVVLYYFNQMSTKEIAEVTGCLEGTVKSRLYTARGNLKAVLAEDQSLGREVTL